MNKCMQYHKRNIEILILSTWNPSIRIHPYIHPSNFGQSAASGLSNGCYGGIGEVEGTVSKMWALISTYLANSETLTKNEVDGIDIGH